MVDIPPHTPAGCFFTTLYDCGSTRIIEIDEKDREAPPVNEKRGGEYLHPVSNLRIIELTQRSHN